MSSSSGCRLLIKAMASWICPFRIISRILIRSSRVSRSTLGSIPDSMRNFSAASLKPSVNDSRAHVTAQNVSQVPRLPWVVGTPLPQGRGVSAFALEIQEMKPHMLARAP